MARRPSKLGVAWTAGRLASRRLFRRGVGAADLELGERLAAQLDEMKGLAMKVGQIVSYMDVPLPEAVQEKLARLQTGQRGMPEAGVREVVEASLGGPVEQWFESFDFEPVAAASIGQVHRARVEGRAVAVKVQYPDVARSFSDDLGAMGRFASLASLASAVDGTALVEELRARLVEECDYRREARMQAAFRRAFAGDPGVAVPEVIGSHSTGVVLTSVWAEGDGFEVVRREASAARRREIAEALVRMSYRSLLQLATIQADPHPGNFSFPPQGPVVFFDFGCVRRLEPSRVEALRGLIEALRAGDRAAAREPIRAMGVVGRPGKFDYDHFFISMEHLHRPLLRERFTFEPGFLRDGMALNGPTSPNARTMSMPPAFVWIWRLQWGLWSILGRLGVEDVPLGGILDALLSQPVQPLSEPSDDRFDSVSDGASSSSLPAHPRD